MHQDRRDDTESRQVRAEGQEHAGADHITRKYASGMNTAQAQA